jgi:tocopherol O-methyltransferase
MSRFDAAQVRRYYDRHTSAFVALGQGGRVGAIHRAVWGPGVRDLDGAFHYVEDQIAELIRRLPQTTETPHVVDLGCGVGASLRYLAERLAIRGTGITLSPVQARLGARHLLDAGLADRVVCIEGDYSELPAGLSPADVAFAIESFVHVPEPVRFFEQCRQLVRPGGLLAICDDVRGTAPGPAAERTLEEFCQGWHINTLIRSDELRTLARTAGFEHESTQDLSPFLEIHRVRDRIISAVLSILGRLPAVRMPLGPLAGGRALQTCLERRWVVYELAVFRRVGLSGSPRKPL